MRRAGDTYPRAPRGRARTRRLLPGLLLALAVSSPSPVWAQQAEAGPGSTGPRPATPLVGQGHWSLDAARRLEGMGLADPGFDPGTATHTLGELQALFEEAVERAERPGLEGLQDLAEGYRDRFREEFPGLAGETGSGAPTDAPGDSDRAGPGTAAGAGSDAGRAEAGPGVVRWIGGSVGAGYRRTTGRVLAGEGHRNDAAWTGARPRPDLSRGTGEARLAAGLGTRAAAGVTAAVDDGLGLREGHLVAGLGPVTFWAGRRAFRFGATDRGGLVYAEGPPGDPVFLDGGGISTESFRLPWIFRHLGPVRAEYSVTVVDANGAYEHPWMVSARGRLAPHPRLSFGVNRGAMYGGEGNVPLSWHKTLVRALFGVRPGLAHGYDNQVVSADVRFRPPLGGLPLVLYGEWGAEDSSGGYKDAPAMLGGIEVTAVPGVPELSLGVDATKFSESCCGNPIWYRHWSFSEGWSEEGRLLGDPLGGHGTEVRMFGRVALLDARLRVGGEVFTREREVENAFAPERAGRSRGGALDADLRIRQRLELSASGHLESGVEAEWDRAGFETDLRLLF